MYALNKSTANQRPRCSWICVHVWVLCSAVRIYIYMYVCVYVCVTMHMCVCDHAFVCVTMHLCVWPCMCVCDHICVCVCICVYMCVYMCVWPCICVCVCVCAYICVCAWPYVCRYYCQPLQVLCAHQETYYCLSSEGIDKWINTFVRVHVCHKLPLKDVFPQCLSLQGMVVSSPHNASLYKGWWCVPLTIPLSTRDGGEFPSQYVSLQGMVVCASHSPQVTSSSGSILLLATQYHIQPIDAQLTT